MKVKETLTLQKFAYQKNTESGDPKVEGLAISPGIYHTYLEFPESEIKNATKTIKGVPLLTNHKNLTENVVGRVRTASNKTMDNGQKATFYEGFIDSEEKDLLRKIDKGIIDSTSIGFDCEHICKLCGNDFYSADCPHWFWDDGFGLTAKNVEVLELSIVGIPADSNASVAPALAAGEAFDKFKDKYPDLLKAKEKVRKELKLDIDSNGEKTMEFTKKEYEAKVSELAKLKVSHETEIDQLVADHEKVITELKQSQENKLASEREENINLKQDNETLKTENETLKGENEALQSQIDEIKEVELSEKRDKVTELNKELNANLTEDEITELSESGLDKYIDMFTSISAKRPAIQQELHATPTYDDVEELDDNASVSDKLFARIQKTRG